MCVYIYIRIYILNLLHSLRILLCEIKRACSKKRLTHNFTQPVLWGPVRGAFYYTRFSCIQDRSPMLLPTLPLILLHICTYVYTY